jgi:hypothetical protein
LINNCDPLTITYIAAISGIVGGLIGAFINHLFSKKKNIFNTKNAAIDEFIVVITDDIRRMIGESSSTNKTLGDTSTIEAVILKIKLIIGDSRVEECWEEYARYENNRKFQESEKRNKSIASLKHLIKILNEHKT